MPKAVDILTTAAGLVGGERDRLHGDKHQTFTNIARLWNAYLMIRRDAASELTAKDAAVMMMLLKAARMESGLTNPDDAVDAAGYAAIAGELA